MLERKCALCGAVNSEGGPRFYECIKCKNIVCENCYLHEKELIDYENYEGRHEVINGKTVNRPKLTRRLHSGCTACLSDAINTHNLLLDKYNKDLEDYKNIASDKRISRIFYGLLIIAVVLYALYDWLSS